jgi:hypothetical protein
MNWEYILLVGDFSQRSNLILRELFGSFSKASSYILKLKKLVVEAL